jgi:Transposase zinc-binding domain
MGAVDRASDRGLIFSVRPEQSAAASRRHSAYAEGLLIVPSSVHRPSPVAQHIERELRGFLDCGILACGFARARCDACGHDFLVAFSCKGRGICRSCTTRRMAETAAHLVEHVFPPVPMRQWVVTFPKRLRFFLHRDPALLGRVRRIVLRAIEAGLRHRCPGAPPGSTRPVRSPARAARVRCA